MRGVLVGLAASLIFLGACVPAKKLVYLQQDDLKKRKEIPKDTVLRTHDLKVEEYRIQPLDLLSVNFETISDDTDAFNFLSKLTPSNRTNTGGVGATNAIQYGVLVNTNGEIEYSVLGKIKVGGLTLFQAKDTIQAIASRYIPDVVVRVMMLNFRFTVLGEVPREQTVTSSNTRLTIMEAIGIAGGLGELADRSHVKVIRQRGAETEIYYLDLLKEDFIESSRYYVQQNDVIIVPPLKQRTFIKYFSSNVGYVTTAITLSILIISLGNN